MIRIFSLTLFLFATSLVFGQAPQVMDNFPVNQKNNAEVDGDIRVTFDTPLDLSTVAYGNFKVFGRWSGPAELSFSMSNDNKTVEMTPFEPFMYGEWITVSLTKSIKSESGENMEHAYVWNFWTETRQTVSASDYPLVKTIELRQGNEGLLQAYGAYAGDLNNDGYSDLTVVNETSDDLRILLNDGTGDYTDFEIIPMGDATPSPNEGADFDNDGEIDLAVCTAHDNELRVLYGDGSGTLGDMDEMTTGMNARGLGVIDFDGDGNDDIVIANRGSSNLSLFQNDGFGNFTSSTMNPTGEGESGLVVTDFNNDGIQDLIIGMFTSNEVLVMEGDGNMGFTETAHSAVDGASWMLGAGDLNGDGFVDVVSANSSSDNVAVLINDTNGDFLPPTYLTETFATFPLAIDLGDLDGDGDLDVVTSYYSSSNYVIFYNDGSGVFTTGPSLDAGTHASCAILHDRDNDGDLDITGTDEGDDIVLLFDNNAEPVATNDFSISLINKVSPNPFSQSIQIEISEACEDCTVSIYNNLGILIRTMQVDTSTNLEWNGRDINGQKVPAGLYFFKIGNDDIFETQKVLFID